MASLIRERDRPRKPWRVDYTERRQRRTRRFATKKQAESFIGALADGKPQARVERLTVRQWIPRWIATHGLGWVDRTVKDRGDFGDAWITPYLGNVRLHELRRSDVREWRIEMIENGATVYTANRAVTVLSAALGAAVADDLLAGNPCAGLKPLRREGVQRRTPATLQEVERIRALLERPRDRLIVSLLAYAGLRPAEVHALLWEDVRAKTIVVRAAGAQAVEKETKTESVRTVPIIRPLADDLAEVDRQEGPVAQVHHNNWTARVWRPARARAGSKATPYSLRHTFASLLIAEGRPVHEVARLLGHSTPRLTLDTYGHLFDEAQLAPRESMEEAALRARREAITWRAAAEAEPEEA